MFAAGAKLVAIESELPDGSYLTGIKGGGRMAANNSSSDIALGAYSSSKNWVIRNLPQNLHADYKICDEEYRPGKIATRAGIYRCSGCGREITSEQKEPLPPHDHHEHTQRQGAIRWTLIVYADHRPKIMRGS